MNTKQTEVRSTVEALSVENTLKLALEALEWINRVNAMDFEYQRKARESLNAIYEALAEQPEPVAEPGRNHWEDGDVFERIGAMKKQPAQQEQGDSNCQDDDGCPTEIAVLQRFWRGEPIPTEHYPAWFRPAQPAQQQEPEQKPVAWVGSLKDPQPHCVTDLKYCSAAQWDTGYHLKYIPLYTSPPANANAGKPWAGLTDINELVEAELTHYWNGEYADTTGARDHLTDFARAIEAKLREKNA